MNIDSGLVSSPVKIGGNALTDSTKNWANNVHKNRLVKITKGPGVGQLAVILGNSSNTLVIRGVWPQNIAAGVTYEILSFDIIQVLRDVFGGGLDISLLNPLETHDPKVEDIEDKLDHPEHGLAALKALLDSLAGGAFYGSYGPKNVEVDNDVDFGTILYDPAGNIITTGEITPGTYTVRRVRGAVDTEIVAAAASSEAAGRVYMTYNFPAASWNVGDIFYITFTGIIVTLNGVTTEYPNLFIWGRVVREADISAKVDDIETKLDALGGAVGGFYEQEDVAFNVDAVLAAEADILHLAVADTRYIIRSLRLKCANPGVETVTVRLYELVNDGLVEVDSFDITAANFGTYHSLMDMFGLPHLAGDELQVTVQATAAGPYEVTGQYSHAQTNP